MNWKVFFLTLACSTASFAQDSLRVDSVRTVPILYGRNGSSIRSHSNFSITPQQSVFQLNSGISVLNNQRGLMPGLNLGSSPFISSTQRPLVIDGVVMFDNALSFINLNSFEYSGMNVLARGNGAAILGGNSANGLVALQSKSGQGINRPTVEFNSLSQVGWNDMRTQSQWYLSNSLAFMQDFGKLDLRVSANNIQQPHAQYQNPLPDLNQFKVNAGFDFTDKLSARAIVEHTFNETNSKFSYRAWNSTNTIMYDRTLRNGYLGGNLMLEYKALNWLKISAQATENRISTDTEIESLSATSVNRNRRGYSLLASAEHAFKEFAGNVSLGVAFERQDTEETGKTRTSFGPLNYERRYDLKRQSVFAITEVGFRNYAFIQTSARLNTLDYSVQPVGLPDQFSFSAGGSFIFSDAFKIPGRFISSGKVRGSYGKFNGCSCEQYPVIRTLTQNAPTYQLTNTNSTELGADLSWFNNRLSLTYNYFTGLTGNPRLPTIIDPSTGYVSTYINGNFDFLTKAHEIILGGNIIQRKAWNLRTSLIWSNVETEVVNNNTDVSGILLDWILKWNPSYVTNPGTIDLGDPNPDWTGSWLTNLSYKNFSLRVLIDYSKGGQFFYSNFSTGNVRVGGFILPGVRPSFSTAGSPLQQYFPNHITLTAADYGFGSGFFGTEDKSYAKLREVSIGYQIPFKKLQNTFVSVSGRNLVLLYSKSGYDPEASEFSFVFFQKAVSLNLLLTF